MDTIGQYNMTPLSGDDATSGNYLLHSSVCDYICLSASQNTPHTLLLFLLFLS